MRCLEEKDGTRIISDLLLLIDNINPEWFI